ncbi:MAG: flagellar hook-length control protein FliK [Clostridiales bacterium]|nr:flagellar hook-length control protein FliK [Clostridiales bacterium]
MNTNVLNMNQSSSNLVSSLPNHKQTIKKGYDLGEAYTTNTDLLGNSKASFSDYITNEMKETFNTVTKDKDIKSSSESDKTNTESIYKNTNSSSKIKNLEEEPVVEDKKVEAFTKEILSKEELEQVMIMLQAASQTIIEEVSQVLNISQEELEDLLEASGLTALDLLNNNNLSSFYMAFKEDSNMINILTDENLALEYANLMEVLDSINQGLNQELMETLEASNLDLDALISDLLVDDLMVLDDNEALLDSLLEVDLDIKDQNSRKELMADDILPADKSFTRDNKSINIVVEDQRNESSNSTSKDSDKRMSYNTTETSGFEANLNNFNMNIANETSANNTSQSVRDVHDVTLQIIEQVKVKLQDNSQVLEIDLHPNHLGKLTLEIAQKNGLLTAKFLAQNEGTKELIESQMSILKEQLSLQGLKVEDIEVEVGLSEFFQNQGNESDSNQGKHNQERKVSRLRHMVGEDLPEELLEELPNEDLLISYEDEGLNNNTVSYTA